MNGLFYGSIIAITTCILLFTGYLFYFGTCEAIRTYWLIAQTPGRCIPEPTSAATKRDVIEVQSWGAGGTGNTEGPYITVYTDRI